MDTNLAVASKRDWRSYSDRPVPEEVQRRILDAGRVAGSAVNKQPWRFVVVESAEAKERVAGVVYAAANIETCAFAVAIATDGGGSAIDVGRAMQNMFLVGEVLVRELLVVGIGSPLLVLGRVDGDAGVGVLQAAVARPGHGRVEVQLQVEAAGRRRGTCRG